MDSTGIIKVLECVYDPESVDVLNRRVEGIKTKNSKITFGEAKK